MARTRTLGIRVDRNGGLIIDKEHRGMPIYVRLGVTSQEEAEQRLAAEIDRVDALLERNANPRPTFADCAVRYLADSKDKRSVDATAWHIRLLIPYVGSLDIHPDPRRHAAIIFADRLASGVSATTINRSLEIVRTMLTRAARSYRDDAGRPWLETSMWNSRFNSREPTWSSPSWYLGGRYWIAIAATPQRLERGSSVTNNSLAANQRPHISLIDRRHR
jgi:hypothetical protein